jgi:uncharacterized membrane protein YgaE (UPF0421/DUF939 family)
VTALRSHFSKQHLGPLQLAFRAGVAAGISVWIGHLLSLPNPVFAMTAAVIVVDLDPASTRALAWKRFAGTFMGALLGALGAIALPDGPFAIVLSVIVTMSLCHVLKLDGSARISGYLTALIVMQYGDTPWRYAGDRFLETTLGIVVALLVSLVPHALRPKEDAPT